ncbi:hypothetical protein [Sulfurovum sp.]|uniref:hypothetical protein n=1 Tax=Sulfurovum sp. TaxID=1969726 RepID=UPI0025DB80BD|nr:hypothetical protein [Sulfurovum sp.]
MKNGHNFIAAVKNLAIDGRYYWVFTDFDILRDENGKATGYKASRKKISKHVTDILDRFIKNWLKLKKRGEWKPQRSV